MNNQQLEGLFARVKVQHVNGKELGYWYSRQSLGNLGLKKDSFEGADFLEMGNKITLGNKEFIITNINFKLETELYDMSSGYGASMIPSDAPLDFNVTINVFVDSVS